MACATKAKAGKRLPRSWKRKGDDIYCDLCWSQRYLLRAITVPVVSPLDSTWPELRTVLREMWAAATQASNWILTELYARDVRRRDEKKMPPMPNIYLYPEVRERFPQLPSQTVAALENTIKATYRAKRYEVLWTVKSSLPVYRYPTPFPVPNRGWHLKFEDNQPVVSLRVGDKRLRLRLKGGLRYRRQLTALRTITAGDAIQGELAIYERGDDLLCKMVAWLPRVHQFTAFLELLHTESQGTIEGIDKRTIQDLIRAKDAKEAQEIAIQRFPGWNFLRIEEGIREGTLAVRTAADAMIVAADAKSEKLWTYHGEQIRRWSAEHRLQLQRWAEDSKAEHRPHVPFAQRREESARRYRNRMDSACHQIAAMVAGYAQRRKFAKVEYRDSDQSFCPQFPWFRLRELMREKCDKVGVEFERASCDAKREEREPFAEE